MPPGQSTENVYLRSMFTCTIGGEAGFGVMSAGKTIAKLAVRGGHYTFDYSEYPSIVRGGHNVMYITIDDKPVLAQQRHINCLLALNQQTIDLHADELAIGAIVLYDSAKGMSVDKLGSGAVGVDVPMFRLAKEYGGSSVMRNTAALGAMIAVLGADLKMLYELISEEFAHKKPIIAEKNHDVAKAAYDYVHRTYADAPCHVLKPINKTSHRLLINGNEAAAMASIAAGMQFASIYPMTPTSNIMHVLAKHQEEHNYVYKQPEDEIAAINMAIGAAHAGARAMTATSGGGFCLMSEGLGLAGITETPVVIFEGMRGSPATGLPTWTEQGDLRFVLHAHQGDFPRIVIAPGDMEEVFHMSMQAFNLAERYQLPVVILIDKHLCESHQAIDGLDYGSYVVDRGSVEKKVSDSYERYKVTKDGISPRSYAGSGNHYVANSDEHTTIGYSEESSENRLEQMHKRMKKVEVALKKDAWGPNLYGPKNAKTTIVCWGSTKGAALEALEEMSDVNVLHFTWMTPFPADDVKKLLEKSERIINIEGNYSAQFAGYLREQTGIAVTENFLKYDGRPFYSEEIVQFVQPKNRKRVSL